LTRFSSSNSSTSRQVILRQRVSSRPRPIIVSLALSTPPHYPQLNTHAKKCQVEERTQQRKAKSALDDGNTDIARTYATNAIRKKKEALEYIQLASRLDAVIARLNQQNALSQVDASASTITKSINKLLKKTAPNSMANNMVEFQGAMDELDKETRFMERALGNDAKRLDDQGDVDELLKQLEDGSALTFREQGAGVAVSGTKPVAAGVKEDAVAVPEAHDFMAELTALRGGQ
jgi:charged multivesicular body protein 1